MKIHFDIDCTPEEARRFLGLPDLEGLHAAVVGEMQERLLANLKAMDPETLWKTWMPAGVQNLEQMQKFWSQFTGGQGGQKRG